MFAVGYGFHNREKRIKELLESEPSVAVILAAIHFEWSVKRAILMLGKSSTPKLRKELEETWHLWAGPKDYKGHLTVKGIWSRELCHIKNSAIGKVIQNFPRCIDTAKAIRGRVIHGNGNVSRKAAQNSVEVYLKQARKVFEFAKKHGADLDTRLKARRYYS